MYGGYSVPLKALVSELKLEILNTSCDYENVAVVNKSVGRPGLLFVGFFEYFEVDRILAVGKQEEAYLMTLSDEARFKSIEGLMSKKPCAVVLCHEMVVQPEMLELAKKYDVNMFQTAIDTSEFTARLTGRLNHYLAPRKTIHGVLVEVFGEGILIRGDSGIGKSETALELINRGHRLIADDAVEIKRISEDILSGEAPELIRHYMEFRGIGIINARHIFGVSAIKPAQYIHLVVNLEKWDDYKAYDRLGVDDYYDEILGVSVPSVTLPVSPGRNIAIIIELAAMNNRQKKMGYNAAQTLAAKHDFNIDNNLMK